MRILFDQGTPAPLRRHLGDHTVDTVAERGWSELGDGELFERAESEGYDVLVTTDQNLRHQQWHARRRGLALLKPGTPLKVQGGVE